MLLVVRDEVRDRGGEVADRRRAALAGDLLARLLDQHLDQAVLGAQATHDGLHRHPGVVGDLRERDVVVRRPGEPVKSSGEDAAPGLLGGLGPGGLDVRPFHVHKTNTKCGGRQWPVWGGFQPVCASPV
nr:hypothetical protein [Nocardioides sp. J54]